MVIPTYDEATNIGEVLRRVRSTLPDAEVLVVDDGSPDGTADLAEAAGAELGSVEVLRRPGKSGLGSAYKSGFRRALERGAPIVVEMDADLSHDPADLPRLVQRAEDGADLVIGSRYVEGGAVPGWPASRRRLSEWGNRYIRLMLHMDVLDATAGFRAYRAETLAKVDLDRVRADGYGFQIEMAYAVHRLGGTIEEIPITFRNRTRGESKMSWHIVGEAMGLVTRWGMRARAGRVRNAIRRRSIESPGR